jgi:hypothetical protein
VQIRTPPTGADRQARLDELGEAAGGRTDLLAHTAGILLGTRVDDEYDPRHIQHTAGAAMLLQFAGVSEDDEQVQRAVTVGREWRERYRLRPEPKRERLTMCKSSVSVSNYWRLFSYRKRTGG